MAWSYTTGTTSHIEGDWQFWEYLVINEIQSTQAGYFRLAITSYIKCWSPGTGYTFSSRTASVSYGDDRIYAESAYPEQAPGMTFTGATTYVNLPNSWNGKQLKFYGRLYSWENISPDIYPAYKLTIQTDSHVSSATIKRTSCGTEFGSTGTLSSGDAIYAGDVITVSAQAESGYEIIGLQSSYTVSGDTTISISTQLSATVHIYNGTSWARYSLYVYNGTSWVRYKAKIYNGTSWDNYN